MGVAITARTRGPSNGNASQARGTIASRLDQGRLDRRMTRPRKCPANRGHVATVLGRRGAATKTSLFDWVSRVQPRRQP